MDIMDSLGYNTSLAEALAQAHALTGSWRSITRDLRAAEALTSEDIQQVRTLIATSLYPAQFIAHCLRQRRPDGTGPSTMMT